jgi:hypothetical protein
VRGSLDEVDGDEVSISELFEYLGTKIDPAPNVVLKGDVGEQRVSRLVVKDVPMANLFRVVETVANVDIEIIDSSQEGSVNDPFAGGPSVRKLASSGIIVVSSRLPNLDDPFARNPSRPAVKPSSKVEPVATEAPSVIEEAPGFVTISTEEELLDTLAHLGAVIVTREDGTEWLYLTNSSANFRGRMSQAAPSPQKRQPIQTLLGESLKRAMPRAGPSMVAPFQATPSIPMKRPLIFRAPVRRCNSGRQAGRSFLPP